MDYYIRCLLPGIDQATQLISWILAYARKCVRNRKIGVKIDLKNKILLQGVFFFQFDGMARICNFNTFLDFLRMLENVQEIK